MEQPLPALIGRFRPIERLGQGAFAVVFKAHPIDDPARIVALKVALPGDAGSLLQCEQRIHARVEHPGMVRLLGANQAHEPPFLVLEHCAGGSLRQRLDRAPIRA